MHTSTTATVGPTGLRVEEGERTRDSKYKLMRKKKLNLLNKYQVTVHTYIRTCIYTPGWSIVPHVLYTDYNIRTYCTSHSIMRTVSLGQFMTSKNCDHRLYICSHIRTYELYISSTYVAKHWVSNSQNNCCLRLHHILPHMKDRRRERFRW